MNHTFTLFDSRQNLERGFARAEDRIVGMEAEIEAGSQLYEASKNVPTYLLDPAFEEEVRVELYKLKQAKAVTV